jgi:hypothetical protein
VSSEVIGVFAGVVVLGTAGFVWRHTQGKVGQAANGG